MQGPQCFVQLSDHDSRYAAFYLRTADNKLVLVRLTVNVEELAIQNRLNDQPFVQKMIAHRELTFNGRTYHAMFFYHDGQRLSDLCAFWRSHRDVKRDVPSFSGCLVLVKNAVQCLKHFHDAGYIHCGLTEENFIVQKDFSVKLTGFAHAMPVGTPNAVSRLPEDFQNCAPE